MYILEKIKLNIAKLINKALRQNMVQASDLVYPPNAEFGDFSLPMFNLAKAMKKTPAEAGEFLAEEIKNGNMDISAKAAGPYLNFIISREKLAKSIISEIFKIDKEYGRNKTGKKKRVMVEYSNANTHKEYHVGHLRNICYGDAVNKILVANGYNSIPVSYINDFGIHVAKTIWAYNKFYKNKKLPENKGYFLGKVYTMATQELEKDPMIRKVVSSCMKKIESKKGAEFKLWQRTRKWSINSFAKIYRELGIKFFHIYYESEFIEKGIEMVAKLYNKNFLTRSDGAIIANLEKYGLGVLLFLRSDCTALYPVADLPLAIEKFKHYRLVKSIYIVDIRQNLYFKQLFKILELLGYNKEMVHIGFDFVKLPEGMMSSRTGNVITYEDLREQIFKKAYQETKKRHHNWKNKEIEAVANKLTNGAIKFEMIKVSANQIITFDINQSLRFDGYTAAYLQYTNARIQSIIKKSKVNPPAGRQKLKIDFSNLIEKKEEELVMMSAKYPEIISKAGVNYDPSEIAKFLFELAREFNDYYQSTPVLKAEPEVRTARLALIGAVSRVIINGLDLLGIEVMKEM